MTQDLINRYLPGGDIYAKLVTLYGADNADAIATAAKTGDETQVNAALTKAKYGAPMDTSVADIFAQQILTDPMAAPLESANTVIGNTFWSFLKNKWVLLALGVTVGGFLFFTFDGPAFIRAWMKRKAKA